MRFPLKYIPNAFPIKFEARTFPVAVTFPMTSIVTLLGIKVVVIFDALPNRYLAEIFPEDVILPDTFRFPNVAEVETVTFDASTFPYDVTLPIMFKFAAAGGEAFIPMIFEPSPIKFKAVIFPVVVQLFVMFKFP
ncbi:hypothetical protein AR158_C047R [Paramecium bursaria Chlorella virus AR158]|nr:hypothetical protein AR158_C047R [Paramecium bursaria Chlorella virus AR158]ABU43593.1 hypothetical protein AR158_C047R [Paramecium bursaria Chlorella virus AR158]